MPKKFVAPPEIVLPPDSPDALDPLLDRIVELITEQQRDIFVAINGSGNNVGKSTLLAVIVAKLGMKGIPCETTQMATVPECQVGQRQLQANRRDRGYGVLIFQGMEKQGGKNLEQLRRLKRGSRLAIQEVFGRNARMDLYLGVYRPDRPFTDKYPLADILIRNEGARDK